MGTEAAWVPLVLAAVSATGTYVNNRNTARRADREAALRLTNQNARQREADQEISNLITETAASNPEEEIAKSAASYAAEMERNKGSATGGIADVLGASDAYKKDAAKDAQGVSQYGELLSGLFSRIDGAQMQRQGELSSRMSTQNVIDMIARRSQGQDALSDLRMNAIRNNPLLTAVSEIAAGAASSYGGGKSGVTGGGFSGMSPYKVRRPPGKKKAGAK